MFRGLAMETVEVTASFLGRPTLNTQGETDMEPPHTQAGQSDGTR